MTAPTNKDRARWARDALAVFTAETFGGDHPSTMNRDDLECAVADLICDLLHFAAQQGFDPQVVLEHGNAHFVSRHRGNKNLAALGPVYLGGIGPGLQLKVAAKPETSCRRSASPKPGPLAHLRISAVRPDQP